MVDQVPPYCIPCDEFHEEDTCPIMRRIIESSMDRKDVGEQEIKLTCSPWGIKTKILGEIK